MSSVLSLDTSGEEEVSHMVKGGLLDFEDSLGEGDQKSLGYEEYIRVLTAGKDLSSPVKLSANKDIQARLVGKNAFIISTPRKLFSFSRKEVYQHYLGSIYRRAHTSPPKPTDGKTKPRRSTFEPTPSRHPLLSPVSETSNKEQGLRASSPDARRLRSQTMETVQSGVPSNRTLLEVAFSPYVNSPGTPTSELEIRLGSILRYCDKDAVEKMLAMADACPEPDETADEKRRDLIKSVRSLKALAEERRKKEETQSDDRYMLNDELKYMCRKRISELSFKRDWQGEKALRDRRNETGQLKIRLPHRKILPVTKGIPQAGPRVRRKRDGGGGEEVRPPPLISGLEPKKPLASHAPDIERVVVQVHRRQEMLDPNEVGLLTASELIDIGRGEESIEEDRLPATAEYDSAILSAACSNLVDSGDCASESALVTAVFEDDVLDAMCNIINEDIENAASAKDDRTKKKQFGRIELNQSRKPTEREWAPLLSSRSRPSSGRPATGGGRAAQGRRPQSAAPASAGALPSAFSTTSSRQPSSELLLLKAGSQSDTFVSYGSPTKRGTGADSPTRVRDDSPVKVSRDGFMQPGGNGVLYRDEHRSTRGVVEVHSPVKYWAKSKPF